MHRALADLGFRFSMDHVADLRIEPRELAERGFRFIKVPARCCSTAAAPQGDIHPADFSDLLGRFGIDLIAEKIESEARWSTCSITTCASAGLPVLAAAPGARRGAAGHRRAGERRGAPSAAARRRAAGPRAAAPRAGMAQLARGIVRRAQG
jgi:hypothetical protein